MHGSYKLLCTKMKHTFVYSANISPGKPWISLNSIIYCGHLEASGFFPHETRGETGKPSLLRAMSTHQIFFIRIVHSNKILGIFDKPASREQSCYKMTYLEVPVIIFGLRILLRVLFIYFFFVSLK